MTLTDDDLAAIKARCNAATAGPWRRGSAAFTCTAGHRHTEPNYDRRVCRYTFSGWMDDQYQPHQIARDVPLGKGDTVPDHFIIAGSFGGYEGGGVQSPADADFIAHARTDLPNTVAAYEALQVRVAELEEALEVIANPHNWYWPDGEHNMSCRGWKGSEGEPWEFAAATFRSQLYRSQPTDEPTQKAET